MELICQGHHRPGSLQTIRVTFQSRQSNIEAAQISISSPASSLVLQKAKRQIFFLPETRVFFLFECANLSEE